MRQLQISEGEYYHLCNRGNNKQVIFNSDRDRARLLFLFLHLQSDLSFKNIGRHISNFMKTGDFGFDQEVVDRIVKKRQVDLVSFCLMPNHFHLIVYERGEGGIAKYMQRSLNAYTKYFNTLHSKSGHVFQGTYQAVHISSNDQLLYASAYVHRNARKLSEWARKVASYPWSSYRDCVTKNRWGNLLDSKIILDQFDDGKEYKEWVETSGAKENEWEIELAGKFEDDED